jgi:hypothetical protein
LRGVVPTQIAAERHISLSTVKTYIGSSLMAKLGARNRVEVAMWGYETGRVREQRPASSASRKAGGGELSRRVQRERPHRSEPAVVGRGGVEPPTFHISGVRQGPSRF